jgi:hypothetical protein
MHRRVALRRPVAMVTPDGGEYRGVAADLSEDGMRVVSDFLLPACSICRVRALDGGPPFEVDATVMRSRDGGGDFELGLEFESTSDRDRAALRRILLSAGPRSG